MNVYDSTRMQALLGSQGFKLEENIREADVVVINTCSIRDKSEHKVLSLLGELKGLKQKDPKKVLAVAGCVGQRMGRTLLQRVPHLDLVMGPDSVDRVGELVGEVIKSGERMVDAKLDTGTRSYSQPLADMPTYKPAEYLTVMKGCDHFCTYCIVPFVRGREKSRPIAEIIADVKKYVDNGTKEITFLGQNINTYGKGTGETLAQLIEQANLIPGLERIRYVTSHPRDLGQDLIDQFGTVEKLCPSLHLPFQSGSDAILKAMSRLYTRDEYKRKIEALRKACPSIALSTDVIVGFPGETDEDFEQTLSLLKEVQFSLSFLFKYSPRPGTRAFNLGDTVPESVKEERLKRIQEANLEIVLKENLSYVGKKVPVLVEAVDKKDRYFTGRNPYGKLVHILNAGTACVGKTIDVEISDASGSNLKGYYVGAPRVDRQSQGAIPLSV